MNKEELKHTPKDQFNNRDDLKPQAREPAMQ